MRATNLQEAFESFSSDALRLEGLPLYSVPGEVEARRAVASGQTPDFSFLDAWISMVTSASSSGRTVRRIRLVGDPLSDYEAFELGFGYPLTAQAGEQIRVLARSTSPTPLNDYWIFDHEVAFSMQYDPAGAFLGADKVSPADATRIIESIESLWSAGSPWTAFRLM